MGYLKGFNDDDLPKVAVPIYDHQPAFEWGRIGQTHPITHGSSKGVTK